MDLLLIPFNHEDQLIPYRLSQEIRHRFWCLMRKVTLRARSVVGF